MNKTALRTASISCLAIWGAVWILFLAIRFSSFDIRVIPGIGMVMLAALGVALLAPIVSTALAGAAIIRNPRQLLNWLTLAGAIAVLFGQGLLFLASRWL